MSWLDKEVAANLLGVAPVLASDLVAVACFSFAASAFGLPFWLAPFVGVAVWRGMAQ